MVAYHCSIRKSKNVNLTLLCCLNWSDLPSSDSWSRSLPVTICRCLGQLSTCSVGRFTTSMLFRASTFYLMVLLAAVCNGLLYPGQPTPDFSVPTLRGINFTNTNIPSEQRAPIMFYRYDERSLFLQAEWNSNSSVTAFVKNAPNATHFVFFASQNSKENVWRLRDRLAGAARVQGKEELLDRCHFVPVPPESVTPWISEVFQKWKCSSYGCRAHRLHFTKRSHHGSKSLSTQAFAMTIFYLTYCSSCVIPRCMRQMKCTTIILAG